SAAARAFEEAQARRTEATRALEDANASAAGFRLLAESMEHLAPEAEPDAVFDGDVETAQARYRKLNSALAEADAAVDQAGKRVRACADVLAQYATEKRFERLSSPVRQQII